MVKVKPSPTLDSGASPLCQNIFFSPNNSTATGTDSTDQSILLSSINLMEALQKQIISECKLHRRVTSTDPNLDQAEAVFRPIHTEGGAFGIINSKKCGETGNEYEARLIVRTARLPTDTYGNWVLVSTNPSICKSPVDAMADLLEFLYAESAPLMAHVGPGESFCLEVQD